MNTYFDCIEWGDRPITNETTLYLVNFGEDKFGIRGTSHFEELQFDPLNRATHCWLIPTESLLEQQQENSLLFPEGKLTTAALSLQFIKDNLNFDPSAVQSQPFPLNRDLTLDNAAVEQIGEEIASFAVAVMLAIPLAIAGTIREISSAQRERALQEERERLRQEAMANANHRRERQHLTLAVAAAVSLYSFFHVTGRLEDNQPTPVSLALNAGMVFLTILVLLKAFNSPTTQAEEPQRHLTP